MESDRIVGTVKALMHEVGLQVPCTVSFPKCKLLGCSGAG